MYSGYPKYNLSEFLGDLVCFILQRQSRSISSPHPDFGSPGVSQCPLQRGEAAVAEQRPSGTAEPTQVRKTSVLIYSMLHGDINVKYSLLGLSELIS